MQFDLIKSGYRQFTYLNTAKLFPVRLEAFPVESRSKCQFLKFSINISLRGDSGLGFFHDVHPFVQSLLKITST